MDQVSTVPFNLQTLGETGHTMPHHNELSKSQADWSLTEDGHFITYFLMPVSLTCKLFFSPGPALGWYPGVPPVSLRRQQISTKKSRQVLSISRLAAHVSIQSSNWPALTSEEKRSYVSELANMLSRQSLQQAANVFKPLKVRRFSI